jgi:hypothetical protein
MDGWVKGNPCFQYGWKAGFQNEWKEELIVGLPKCTVSTC